MAGVQLDQKAQGGKKARAKVESTL